MKKEELEKIGLTKEQIKAVQKIHGTDMQKVIDKTGDRASKKAAIESMLHLLCEPKSLDRVLNVITSAYYNEQKEMKAVEDKDSIPERRERTSSGTHTSAIGTICTEQS